MKITPQMIGGMSGSLGGFTASHNRSGTYLRRRVIPTNPNTQWQQNVKAAFGALVDRWTNNLTDTQRARWSIYGENTPWTNTLGETIHLTGQQEYIRSNIVRMNCTTLAAAWTDIAAIATEDDGPLVFDRGSELVINNITAEYTAPASEELAVTVDFVSQTADQTIVFSLGRPQNGSTKFYKGPFTIVATAAGNAGPGTFSFSVGPAENNPYEMKQGTPVTGQQVWVKAVVVQNLDGRVSTAVMLPVTAEAAA